MTRRRFGIGEADEGERARHVVELPGRQAEMKAWADENDIDLNQFFGFKHGIGFRHGFMMK